MRYSKSLFASSSVLCWFRGVLLPAVAVAATFVYSVHAVVLLCDALIDFRGRLQIRCACEIVYCLWTPDRLLPMDSMFCLWHDSAEFR